MIAKSLRCGSDRIGSLRIVLLVTCLLLIGTIANAQSISNNITVSGATCPNGGSADANCVTFAVPADAGTLTFSITGTYTGVTVAFEYKTINSAYAALTMVNTTSLAAVSSTAANGNWVTPNAGYTFIRMRASALSTGTVVAVIKATNTTSVVGIVFGGTAGSIATTTDITGINGVAPAVGAGTSNTGTIRTAEATDSVLGATVTSSRIAVNPIVGQAGIAAGAGAVGATVPRFTLASDDPLVVAATVASTPILANGLDDNPLVTVLAGAGVLDSYYCYNGTGAVAYVQFLDATSPTLGATTPKWSIAIVAGGAGNLSNMNLSFANAIKVASTTTATGSTGAVMDCNFGAH